MALAAVGLKTHIYNNHLKSTLLLAGFPLLLLAMMLAFFMLLGAFAQMDGGAPVHWPLAFDMGIDGVQRFGIWAFAAAAAWFTAAWFMHTSMIRSATNARPITRAEYPKLYNMLENLCVSRGLPMPAFDLIDSNALNAFASGINNKTYRIVLTRGIIERLDDEELEAVIAHELTHIVNQDVRLLIISVIFVGIISFAAEMVYRSLIFSGGGRGRDGKNHILIFLIALVVLIIGHALALVIRFALSRKREYLADAGAVELTKNPEAMMRALLKISGKDKIPGMPDEVQQMCIENSHAFMGMFATHPPIEDRVRALSAMTNTPVPTLNTLSSSPSETAPRGPWG